MITERISKVIDRFKKMFELEIAMQILEQKVTEKKVLIAIGNRYYCREIIVKGNSGDDTEVIFRIVDDVTEAETFTHAKDMK